MLPSSPFANIQRRTKDNKSKLRYFLLNYRKERRRTELKSWRVSTLRNFGLPFTIFIPHQTKRDDKINFYNIHFQLISYSNITMGNRIRFVCRSAEFLFSLFPFSHSQRKHFSCTLTCGSALEWSRASHTISRGEFVFFTTDEEIHGMGFDAEGWFTIPTGRRTHTSALTFCNPSGKETGSGSAHKQKRKGRKEIPDREKSMRGGKFPLRATFSITFSLEIFSSVVLWTKFLYDKSENQTICGIESRPKFQASPAD